MLAIIREHGCGLGVIGKLFVGIMKTDTAWNLMGCAIMLVLKLLTLLVSSSVVLAYPHLRHTLQKVLCGLIGIGIGCNAWGRQ